MIIELFGLPASGKTTLARALEAEGAIRVKAPRGVNLIWNALPFFFWHPVRTGTQLWYLFRYAPRGSWYTLFIHAVLAHAATWQQAVRLSHKGKVALIDQGHHQNLLSVFGRPPGDTVLERYQASFPRPNLLLIVETDTQVRTERLSDRPNPDAETVLRRDVAEQATYQQSLTLFARKSLPYQKIQGDTTRTLSEILTKNISYVTVARMPTEKAHGISIAHMCAAFAAQGMAVELVVPSRHNSLSGDIFSYYGVPKTFSVRVIPTPDFVGQGCTHPFFFFLQRILFTWAVKRSGVASRIIYTREPEIAQAFSTTHKVVYEAHRWPRGIAGSITAYLLRKVKLIVANSHGTAAAVAAAVHVPSIVAPNGFDPLLFGASVRSRELLGLPEGVLALYVGSDAPWKGVDVLREAVEGIEPSKLSVAIIGGNNVCVNGSLRELGRIDPAKVPEYMKSADILILPNVRVSEESERFTSPIKLFEYLAAGKAIIASDLPSIREILLDSEAVFVPPGDVLALKEALLELVRNPVLRAEKAAAAARLAPQFTWSARAERVVQALAKTKEVR